MKMQFDFITMQKEKAKEKYKQHLEIIKKHKTKALKEAKRMYYHLSKGRKLLDIWKVFENAGLNSDGNPRLAIAPANLEEIRFKKRNNRSSYFFIEGRYSWDEKWFYTLPKEIYPKWNEEGIISTKVPTVPAKHIPKGKLENYWILWDVKTWDKLPDNKDPILLRQISDNVFVVIAKWNLTKLEKAILRGR